ncbi:saccharopine dehydrogenase family protein [Portibacter marinus]|uniref:saccharopine dehydrogenase family protein n=1 Tax=Portibacter marinus TaxID=2898660 RepID=UPI001F1C3265|nr:saccharopine dehydrogenase C-terminal domain-containing protein [Portibacter marinus]
MNPTIIICGAGGIGRAAALILACNPAMYPKVYIGDINSKSLGEAMSWITEGKNREVSVKSFIMPLTGTNEEIDDLFAEADVILDCLPGSEAPRIARLAVDSNAHYANLTEYVDETNQIIALAQSADKGFLLQTGIAPGYVNVLGLHLYQQFQASYGVDKLQSLKMRVGALSASAGPPSYYAYTWSTIGVATEYMKDTSIIRDGHKKSVSSLSNTEQIIINGEQFEADYTSGGSANLPGALEGKVMQLDYKTLRYPGHYEWVKRNIDQYKTPAELDDFMRRVVPTVESDRIVMYASAMGFDKSEVLRCIDKSYDIPPTLIGGHTIRAIQATTASSLCEAAYYLLRNEIQGVVLQSDIDTSAFLNGPYVSRIYGEIS